MEQLRLFSFAQEDWSEAALLLSEANSGAWESLQRWRSWPGGALALVGPPCSGKSHMAAAWLSQFGEASAREDGRGPFVIDDAHLYPWAERLALLLDRAKAGGGPALLVGRGLPAAWPTPLPDLRSRLMALPVAQIEEPDEVLLARILERFCKARFIKLTEEAAMFLAQRIERSFAAAREIVNELDRMHVRGRRPVTIRTAARALRTFPKELTLPTQSEEA